MIKCTLLHLFINTKWFENSPFCSKDSARPYVRCTNMIMIYCCGFSCQWSALDHHYQDHYNSITPIRQLAAVCCLLCSIHLFWRLFIFDKTFNTIQYNTQQHEIVCSCVINRTHTDNVWKGCEYISFVRNTHKYRNHVCC